MNWGSREALFLLRFNFNSTATLKQHLRCRTLVKVRLKWIKDETLDNIIDTQTNLKAAYLLKNSINRSSAGYVTSKSIRDWRKPLGLSIPTVRFIRRYPTLFKEFSRRKYPSMPCFRLTEHALNLHDKEPRIFEAHEADLLERLCKVLMMTKDKMVPFISLHPLIWDLGLPNNFDTSFIQKYPDYFRVVEGVNGLPCLKLLKWNDEFAVSVLQKGNENLKNSTRSDSEYEFSKFRTGQSSMAFPLRFPRNYYRLKEVKAWMEEFQKLPYISPYEDSTGIDMNSDIMEKRIVSLLHEFLSLTVHKMTKSNYLGSLRDELNLPEKFTRIYTRYPGIFYVSMKCETVTVALREGYCGGELAKPCPLAKFRGEFYHVMRTGLMYGNKGVHMLPQLNAEEEDEYDKGEKDETVKDCNVDGSSDSEHEFDGGIPDLFGDGSF